MKHQLEVSPLLSGDHYQEVHTNGLVFLDIDGVLNSRSWYKRRPPRDRYASRELHELDPVAVRMVSRFCKDNCFHVVVSSSWRILNTAFEIEGFLCSVERSWDKGTIIGVTPRYRGIRGNEIAEWQQTNGACGVPYVIVDDDVDMKPEQLPNFVHTDNGVGITEHDIQKMLNILEGQ
jgi:hypothetical protein